jgi:predicted dehydrogenase
VLCEKAFALNSFDAKEMIEAARKDRVFIMEAFWTKFLPQYEKVISLIQSGEIGAIKIVQADFGFKAPTPAQSTIVRTEFRGRCVARYWYLSGFFSHLFVGKTSGNPC